jgi:hypothetical protein
MHYFEPHAGYKPAEPFVRRFLDPADTENAAVANAKLTQLRTAELSDAEVRLLASLYNGEVATVDAELRKLFEQLGHRGFLDRAIIVLVADHGEEFREHGGMGHGSSLYNELIRIPLIIVAPGYEGGRTVDENVSLVDVAPTLLDLAGLSPEPRFEGRSLVPLLKAKRTFTDWHAGARAIRNAFLGPSVNGQSPPDIIVQLEPSGGKYDLRRHTEAIIRGSTKLLIRPSGAMDRYELSADPGEASPSEGAVELSQTLRAALDDATANLGRHAAVAAQRARSTKPVRNSSGPWATMPIRFVPNAPTRFGYSGRRSKELSHRPLTTRR